MSLETRYRRLLALYPPAHRDLYEEEMLAVLLADAAPGQRRPGRAAAFDLVVSAIRERVRYAGTAITGTAWRDAAAVFGTVLPLLLLLKVVRPLLADTVFNLRTGGDLRVAGDWELAFIAGWTAVTVLAVLGWRRVAAALALVCALAQTVQLGQLYRDDPVTVLYATWSLLVALLVVACLAFGRGAQSLRRLVPGSTLIAAAVAVPLVFLWPVVDNLLGQVHWEDGWAYIDSPVGVGMPFMRNAMSVQSPAALSIMAAAVLAALVSLARTGPALRRRLLALCAPIAAMFIMINATFDGYYMSALRFDPPVLLVPGQWVALVGVPVGAFLVAALLVHRRERTLELVELGRAARRANPGASHLTDAEQSAP